MPQIIEVPGHGQVEFPDGMSDDQIVSAIKANAPKPATPLNHAAANPEVQTPFGTIQGETSTGFNPAAMLIKAGGALTSLQRGADQLKYGPVDWAREKMGLKPTGISDALKAQVDSEKPAIADLQAVHPGSSMLGDVLAAGPTPWRILPMLAATEYGSPTERLEKAGITYAGGKLAQKGGEIAGRAFKQSGENAAISQAQNSVRDQAIADAGEAGLKTIPSVSGGSMTGRIIEGLTGKEKAKQLASVKNQPIIDKMVRDNFGLPPEAPLVKETMRSVRAEAAATGYEPVRQIPRMDTDASFRAEVSRLTSRADNASKDFGELSKSDVAPLVEQLKAVKAFSGDTAVDQISILREKASDAYAKGDKSLGAAYRQAAEAIEGQVERNLAKSGKDGVAMLAAFREARTKMAQSFDVEKAIREGKGTVDAQVLKRMYEKNPKRMSGDIGKLGRIASAMPEVMQVPKDGWANPMTAADSWLATLAGIASGNLAPFAIPAARAGGRYGLLSNAGQEMFAKPSYGPNSGLGAISGMLNNPAAPYGAGLLGYELSQ